MKVLLVVVFLFSTLFAGGSSVGNLRNPRSARDMQAMGSGYYDCRNLVISDTVVVDSVYSGLMLISIKNETDSVITIKFYTDTRDTTTDSIHLPAYSHSGLLPSIHTIIGTAGGSTSSAILLYFWNLTN